jgi:hypothetical protein
MENDPRESLVSSRGFQHGQSDNSVNTGRLILVLIQHLQSNLDRPVSRSMVWLAQLPPGVMVLPIAMVNLQCLHTFFYGQSQVKILDY